MARRPTAPKSDNAAGMRSGSADKPERIIGVSVLTLDNPFFKVIGDNDHGRREEARLRGDRRQRRQGRRQAKQSGQGLHRQEGQRHRAQPVRFEVDRPGHPGSERGRHSGVHRRYSLQRAGRQDRHADRHRQLRRRQRGGPGDDRSARRSRRQDRRSSISSRPSRASCASKASAKSSTPTTPPARGRSTSSLNSKAAAPRTSAYKAAEDALQAHPDLRGIFAINDPAALGARAALEKAGKTEQVKIIGFDGQPEGKQAIKKARSTPTRSSFPTRWALEIVDAIVRTRKGNRCRRKC